MAYKYYDVQRNRQVPRAGYEPLGSGDRAAEKAVEHVVHSLHLRDRAESSDRSKHGFSS